MNKYSITYYMECVRAWGGGDGYEQDYRGRVLYIYGCDVTENNFRNTKNTKQPVCTDMGGTYGGRWASDGDKKNIYQGTWYMGWEGSAGVTVLQWCSGNFLVRVEDEDEQLMRSIFTGGH